jgi:protein TonB
VPIVLHLDLAAAPATPHLPRRRLGPATQVAASAVIHAVILAIALFVKTAVAPAAAVQAVPTTDPPVRLVFLAPNLPVAGGGGGGGGKQQSAPIRRASDTGTDSFTLRVRKPTPVTSPSAPAIDTVGSPPLVLLDARPLSSGTLEQAGLPAAATMSGTSMGPGSGGGVGTGVGTGIGSGRGPGLGPGSGGGTGGGVYRAGGGVTAPRLIEQVRPRYTGDALRKAITGTVILEAIVTSEGCASQIRVVRPLDRGLDQEAIAAVMQWRFEPGRLEGTPVDVLVTILVDFSLR